MLNADRIAKIRRLAEQSPHEGERAAARAALDRLKEKEPDAPPKVDVVFTFWNGAKVTFTGVKVTTT